jgi:micrococcal nuclease
MKQRALFVILACAGVGCGAAHPLAPTTPTFVVERVIDGDTLVLSTLGTVRLIGVDTPETVHPTKPVQYFGREASTFLRTLVLNQSVHVEYDQTRLDRYGRTLAYVYLESGALVNLEIIRQGYGFAYTAFPFRFMAEFRAAEREARERQLGLWAP